MAQPDHNRLPRKFWNVILWHLWTADRKLRGIIVGVDASVPIRGAATIELDERHDASFWEKAHPDGP